MLNEEAWKLKHRLIVAEISRRGDFYLEAINKKVFAELNISSYLLSEQSVMMTGSPVVDALKKVINQA